MTRTIAQRGNGDGAARDVQLGAGRPVLPALRDRPRQPGLLQPDHQLRRQPGRDRRPPGRPDLGQLHDQLRAGPGHDPADRRAAGEARRSSARAPSRRRSASRRSIRASRPGSSAWRSSSLFLLLYYRLLGAVAVLGAGRLRGLLLRPGEADPDHPHAAGDRGVDPDYRGGGRRQHRHLRANKGGGASRAIDAVGDRAGLPQGDRDDHRRERDHPVHGVHPLRARDRRRQGIRVHAGHRHARLAVHRRAVHPGRAGLARALKGVLHSPRALGAGPAAGAVALRLQRRQPVVLLDVRDASWRSARSRSPSSSSTSGSTSPRAPR